MTIARRLVELHGGALWVSSAGPGTGCRFSFSVPQDSASRNEHVVSPPDNLVAAPHASADAPTSTAVIKMEIIPPPRADLEAIYELAVLGKVFDIQRYVEGLETQDACYQPFVRKVWALAQAFEDQQIAALVKEYLEA